MLGYTLHLKVQCSKAVTLQEMSTAQTELWQSLSLAMRAFKRNLRRRKKKAILIEML
jgi:hypothetical protein